MDENYLDSLLNEVSLDKEIDHKIEEELDNQMEKEKRLYQEQQEMSDEDLFNMDLELDINDIQTEQDLHFSEMQMDELDHLDNLADLDIGDLDFADIDFDDLDVTKLDDIETDDLDDLLKEFEGDLDVGTVFGDSNVKEEDTNIPDLESSSFDFDSDILNSVEDVPAQEQTADLNEDSFNADQFLDNLLDDTDMSSMNKVEETPSNSTQEALDETLDEDLDLLTALEEFGGFDTLSQENETKEDPFEQLSDKDNDDLDDILSLLGLEDAPDAGSTTSSADTLSADTSSFQNDESMDLSLDDIPELPPSKPGLKQKLMEIIFGEPDEDDILSEEELAEIEMKKAAKKQRKEEARQAREEKAQVAKEAKEAKSNQKKKDVEDKKILKAQKKALLQAEEMAEAAKEKKLNKPAVVFIFTLFLGATVLFLMGTNNFNYSLVIERAANYFANQKYRKAFDEIVGVEVKEKDEELKDRIYTVMYVERLYESYLNNEELNRPEKALDSLLRGVDKYYEHYEEAEQLGVTSDLDYSFNQIKTMLNEKYGITVEQAVEINAMENYDYVQFIQSVVNQQEEDVEE